MLQEATSLRSVLAMAFAVQPKNEVALEIVVCCVIVVHMWQMFFSFSFFVLCREMLPSALEPMGPVRNPTSPNGLKSL